MFFKLAQTATDYSQELQELERASQEASQALENASAAATTAAATGLSIATGLITFFVVYGIISLAFFVWWIVLLIDLSKREFPEKTTWLVIMIVGFLIGLVWLVDILYYFMVVKKGTSKSAPSAPQEPEKK